MFNVREIEINSTCFPNLIEIYNICLGNYLPVDNVKSEMILNVDTRYLEAGKGMASAENKSVTNVAFQYEK